jgi:cytochrome bd ubiquinol oxidase subunit II
METVWFVIVGLMLVTYVVLDGFDLGAGVLHLFVARTDHERRTVIAAIGPVWDGNEVWLLAGGGILFYAFPRAYAAGFSGFYMPLMMVLWLLILRGLSVEFRSHIENPLWRSFWDGAFAFASTLLAIVLGAALGNVVRGVPLEPTGYFRGPLFTNFLPGRDPGVLDWYTVLVGVFALALLSAHGALYLAWKTNAPVGERALKAAMPLWTAVVVAGLLTTAATAWLRPALYANIAARPVAWPLVALILTALAMVFVSIRRRRELVSFLWSAAFVSAMLLATAVGVYPKLLASTLGPANDLTIANARAGELAMRVGLVWWAAAIALAIGYFVYLYRSFKGRVDLGVDGHGY